MDKRLADVKMGLVYKFNSKIMEVDTTDEVKSLIKVAVAVSQKEFVENTDMNIESLLYDGYNSVESLNILSDHYFSTVYKALRIEVKDSLVLSYLIGSMITIRHGMMKELAAVA